MNQKPQLIKLLEEAESRYFSKTAIVDLNAKRKTSYTDLMSYAHKVADYIMSLQIEPHSFICLRFPLGMEFFATEIGVWLSGNVPVPIGENFPEERVAVIKNHCDCRLEINIDLYKRIQAEDNEHVQLPELNESDNALLIYTSGSTGTPKGILHDFGSLMNAFHLYEEFNPSVSDRFAYGAPIYFIAHLQYYQFVYGTEVHVLGNEQLHNVDALAQYYTDHEITMTTISPAVLAIFRNTDKHLRCVWTGSENVAGLAPQGFRLYNLYGSTETGGPMCYAEITEASDHPSAGKPIGGIGYEIIDNEICFKGHFCKEYYKDPERTAELYKGGVLHMGDIGKLLPNGDIQYINRKDWMVKINGQRVEPGEIEASIRKIKGIDDAIVKGFDNGLGSHFLVGFYVGPEIYEPEEISKILENYLPHYMIPLHFVHLDKFPLNANGKKDRLSLRLPDTITPVEEYAAPRNDTERWLCDIFSKVFGIERIGIDDDFIALGGDSIKMIRFQQLCTPANISSKTIYKERTIRNISRYIMNNKPITNVPLDKPYQLTQTQLGIYAECVKREGEPVYNVTNTLRLSRKLDTDRLAKAVIAAAKAHPMLLISIYEDEDGVPFMKYREDAEVACPVINIKEEDLNDQIKEMEKPYDFRKDILFRARILVTEQNQYICMGTHHIIFDGLSRQAFYSDIDVAYRTGTAEREPVTGFDITERERILRQDEDTLKHARDWYMNEFGDVEGTTVPDFDINGNGKTEYGKQDRFLSISTDDFTRLGKRFNTSAAAVMYGTFGRLLSVYTGKKDVTFGTIWHGRHDSDTSRTMMMMVKTLPVRCTYDKDTSLEDYMQKINRQVAGARENDIYSFAELSAETGITSDVLFAYHGKIRGLPQIEDCQLELLPSEENETGEALAISVMLEDEKIYVLTEYQKNKYSDEYIARLIDSFDAVLNNIANSPESRVSNISIISKAQEEELGQFRMVAEMELPVTTYHEGIERWAVKTPDVKAVVATDRTLTYREYNEAANRMARALMAKGVTKGDRIVLLLPRTSNFLVAMFAVMKCGAAYIPMDPAYPADRIAYILEDSEGRYVVTTADHVADYSDRAIDIDKLVKESLQFDSDNLNIDVKPSDLAYLIYTSGSTGKPKGVMLEHLGVANFFTPNPVNKVILAAMEYSSVTLCQTTVSFDLSIFEYGTPLFNGKTVVFANEEETINPVAQAELCKRTGVECISGTPSRIAMNMELHDYDELMKNQIKAVMTGGEKLPWSLVERLKQYNVIMVNGYGPTETTMGSSGAVMNDATIVHVGKPAANYSYRILDSDLNELPVGVMGELAIGGISLARGYNKLPEKTAQVFIDWNGERLYRTGDYARWTNDGNVVILGRTDNQVKLNGLRIELGEIETVMTKQDGVKQCVVVIRKLNGQDKLVAYFTATEGMQPSIDDIKKGMAEHLTHYMVPSIFMQLDVMPITPAGKVDVKHLPEPEVMAERIIAPENEKEQKLFDMVAGIIGNDRFGVTTNLLSAGMTSLLAIRLSILIKKEMEVAIKVADIMETPTIREIVNNLITENAASVPEPAENGVDAGRIRPNTPFPLTFAQQGVYFDCLKNPDATVYNIPVLLHIPSSVDAEQLSKVVAKVLGMHPALFSRIINFDDEPMMLYPKSTVAEVGIIELSAEGLQDFRNTAVQPFDLSHGPLFRTSVIKSEGSLYLLLDTHHLVSDGGSMAVIYQQIADLLNGKDIENETYSYFNFAEAQDRFANSAEFLKNVEFFDESMKEYETPPMIPTDFYAENIGEEGMVHQTFENIQTDIDDFCKQNGFTQAQFWFAAISYVLGRYADTDDVYICGISGGRQNLDIAGTVGMFVNTLALHTRIGNQSIREFVAASAQAFSDAMKYENFPFSMIAANYNFQPKFNYVYQLGLMDGYYVGNEEIILEGLETKVPKFPATVSIEYAEGKPSVVMMFDKALYREDTMRRFADSVIAAAYHITQNPELSVRKLSIVSERQKEELNTIQNNVANTDSSYRILDRDLNELPIGVVGELAKERNGEDCTPSGKYAYLTEEGKAVILGPTVCQVILNGSRIELGRIQDELSRLQGVRQCVAVIRKVNGMDRLVAYFSSDNNPKPDIENIKAMLAEHLSPNMVPDLYVILNEFTYTPSGEIAVNELPEPKAGGHSAESCRNAEEQFFCDTFANILNVENVGPTDNFFELGGTSLVAVRVVIEAEKNGYRIDYKSVFDYPTARQLAELVNESTSQRVNESTSLQVNESTRLQDREAIMDSSDSELYDYDYTGINGLLADNILKSFHDGSPMEIKGAVVTGATGYLGLHVIKELIYHRNKPNIYCLVRPNAVQTSRSRLRTMLFYYFNDSFDELLDNRIFIIDGDVTDAEAFDNLPKSGITHLFNCAANVKHFSAGTDIEDVNIGGTRNCIDYCVKNGITLIHTSTYSIAGTTESEHPIASGHDLSETQLYWGQTLKNQYTHAKFIAERFVLEAVCNQGLKAKIMRLGNLSARSEDGEFQVNFSSNAFMGRLRAYQAVGCIQYEMMSDTIEFSPIDEVAHAVILLSETPEKNMVFHPVNANRQAFGNVINCLNRMGIKIDLAEQDAFQNALHLAAEDPEKASILQSMLAYQSIADGKFVAFNGCDYLFTTQLLMRMGFQWSFTTWDYIEQFINAIKGLGFFDEDYSR